MNLQKKSNNTIDKKEVLKLLKEIASSMNAEVIEYIDINDTIEKEVSIGLFVDMKDIYSKEYIEKFKQKSMGIF